MEAPEKIYIGSCDLSLERGFATGCVEKMKSDDIEYIRSDIAELTAEDMRLAFGAVNEAIDNCEGKTKQELFEDALKIFKEYKNAQHGNTEV